MNNRPYKYLSDKSIGIVKKILDRNGERIKSPETFGHNFDSLLKELHRYLSQKEGEIDDIIKLIDRKPFNQGWLSKLSEITQSYRLLYDFFEKVSDEENCIARSERRGHYRALIFRVLTTIGIGFGIMFVYWVAQLLGIDMPFARAAFKT